MVETNTSVVEYKYEWKLKNFLKYYDILRGPEFSPLEFVPLTFVTELTPRVKRTDAHFGYGLNLIKVSKEEIPETCRVELFVKISNQVSDITAKSTLGTPSTVHGMDNLSLFSGYLTNERILYVNTTGITVDSDVTFICLFRFFGHNVTSVSSTVPAFKLSSERYMIISSCLKTLYELKTNSDIQFEIGEIVLKAHLCILVSHSPVFKKMLGNGLAESNSKCIQIEDFDAHVFDCFLRYLYCGDIDDTSFDTVMDLFALADKYAVDCLKKDCREILAPSLTLENVCQVVLFSYLHSDELLKDTSTQFINHHFSLIKETAEWEKVLQECPKLASEIFSAMTANKAQV